MKRSHIRFQALASFALLLVISTLAQAQAFETWVAGDGNDANPCTRDLPCQTFAAAITQTAAGGEINVKKAGEFGPVTIDKSITIDGGGTFAGIDAGGIFNAGVWIDDSTSATPDTAVVTLRKLSINGDGSPNGNGVYFLHGKTLNIENCQILNFSDAGVNILYWPAAGGNVNITNTSISGSRIGVLAQAPVASVTVSLNGCNIENNTMNGVSLYTGSYATIRDSVIQFNLRGVLVNGAGNGVSIVGSQVNHNTTGLYLVAGTTAIIGSSTFMSNSTNFINTQAGTASVIKTFGNNQTETDPIPGVVTNLALR